MTSSYRITLLPGDGIGPEITTVARQLLDAVSGRHGFSLSYDEQPIGGAAIDACGEPLPASTLAAAPPPTTPRGRTNPPPSAKAPLVMLDPTTPPLPLARRGIAPSSVIVPPHVMSWSW